MSKSTQSDARTVGRGMLWLTGAKLFFIASATLLTYLLTILFDKSTFGRYGVVLGVLNVANMMVVQGTLQAVSKHVSEAPGRSKSVRRAALMLQSGFAGIILLIGVLGAPVWAYFLGDSTLTPALRIGFFTTIAYAFYSVFIGEFNGRKLFHLQASMDMSFATIKLILIISAAALGFGVVGAMAGFASTATIMTVVAAILLFRLKDDSPQHTDDEALLYKEITPLSLLKFEMFIIASAGVLNLLLQQDLLLIKGLLSRSVSTGFADRSAGAYNTALLISRLTYQATISITFVIFPLLSRSTFEQDKQKSGIYINTTMKYSLMIVAAIAGAIAALSPEIYSILLPKYTEAAPVASLLAAAYGLFSLMLILSTTLTAAGRPEQSLLVMIVSLVVAVLANWFFIPAYSIWGAAIGTTLGMGTGFLVAAFLVFRLFDTLMKVSDVLKVIVPLGIAVPLFMMWSTSSVIMALAKVMIVGISIPLVLVFSGAFSKNELADVRAALKRGG